MKLTRSQLIDELIQDLLEQQYEGELNKIGLMLIGLLELNKEDIDNIIEEELCEVG